MREPIGTTKRPTVMSTRRFVRATAGSVGVVALATLASGCSADANVAEIVATDEPDVLNVIVDTCNADLDVTFEETDAEVVVQVRNNDREFLFAGGDDCQDAVRIKLDAPLGDRQLTLDDGRPITLTTFPQDPGEPSLDVASARWQVDPDAALDSDSTAVPILVQEIECSGGQPADGRIEVSVDYGPDEVMFAVGVGQLPGEQTCPDNPVTAYLVELDEPLGERTVAGQGQLAD